MTNRLKTVRVPRLILVECENELKISQTISDILNYCSYNTTVNCFTENTDFIISTDRESVRYAENIIPSTFVFDNDTDIQNKILSGFAKKVALYECCIGRYDESGDDFLTYSSENYDADVTARNISVNGGATLFDIIDEGILSRVRLKGDKYSVNDVLICTAALVATGIPVASILGYFNHFAEK